MANPFLPEDYEVSGGSGGNYMKFEDGENKFRILASPIIGWEWWVDEDGVPRRKGARPKKGDKPVRVPQDGEIPADAGDTVKEFWAMPVWNYQAEYDKKSKEYSGQVQVLELTQKSIMRTIHSLARDKEWGSPLGYDLNVVKDGEGLDTTYEVIPSPPKKATAEITKAYKAMTIEMEALYENGDPFGAQSTTSSDLV